VNRPASRRSGLVALVAVSLAVLLGGCQLGGDPSDDASGGLVGTAWVVREIAGTTTLADSRPTMAFGEDGQVSGSDGCNRYAMGFRTQGERIELSGGQGTDIGCAAPIMAQADAFLQALAGATTWRQLEDGSLELGQGDVLAEPADPLGPSGSGDDATAAELAGTSWVLIDLGGSDDFLGTTVTLAFGEDGSVTGSGGCNTYQGPYAVSGMEMAIGPLASTKVACESPAGDIEVTYLAALDAVGLWSIDDAGHLVLAGPTPLIFDRA
jgi:heat shock protein HslJ